MKKLFTILVVTLFCNMWVAAQRNQYFWFNGQLIFGSPIAQTDSITFEASEETDTLFMLLPHIATIIRRDTVYVHDTLYVSKCEEDPIDDLIGHGALKGVFSVGENKKVHFSQGNLQYNARSDTWQFAENQYDIIGTFNLSTSSTYDGWIDLFGWGTSGYDNTFNDPFAVNFQPWAYTQTKLNVSKSTREISGINCDALPIIGKCDTTWHIIKTYESSKVNVYGYGPSTFLTDKSLTGSSANYDWGVYNAISNGGNHAGLWRTLTEDEWSYIIFSRPLAIYLRAPATVCGVQGYMILPDDFALPEGLSWTHQPYSSSSTNYYEANNYDAKAWNALRAAGAVFLPAAGERYTLNGEPRLSHVGERGRYWLSTYYGESGAKAFIFYACGFDSTNSLDSRCEGYSVRLVQDIVE